jgi:hypothetical protein
VYPVLVHALAAIASPAPPPVRRAAAGRSAPGYLLATEVPAHWYPLVAQTLTDEESVRFRPAQAWPA